MTWIIPLILILIIAGAIWLAWTQLNLMLWITAISSRVPVSIIGLIGMRIRGNPSDMIINNMIRAYKAGVKVEMVDLENHYQAKGDIGKVVGALITARNAGIVLDFNAIRQIDLSGKDVGKVVGAVISARNGGMDLSLATAAQIDLSGRDVNQIVRNVIRGRNANISIDIGKALQIDLAGRDLTKIIDNIITARGANITLDIDKAANIEQSGKDLTKIVQSIIKARGANINLDIDKAISIEQSGRDLDKVINALIAAQNAGLDLDLEQAIQIDLAGREIGEAVRNAIQTKIIETKHDKPIKALSKDGVEVNFQASITAKTNVNELLTGAGSDETLLTRVEQKLVSKISSLDSYQQVLQNPTEIANILEPEDGKIALADSRRDLEDAIKKFEEKFIKKENIDDVLMDMRKMEDAILKKQEEIEDCKKQEKHFSTKMEAEQDEEEVKFLEAERKRIEYERGKLEATLHKRNDEHFLLSEKHKKMEEEMQRLDDEMFRKLENSRKNAGLAHEDLAESNGTLLLCYRDIDEIYKELDKAYMLQYKHPNALTNDSIRKDLETANREMENAKKGLHSADEDLKFGRDELKIVKQKLIDIGKLHNEGKDELTYKEIENTLKKLEDARNHTIDGRNSLEESHHDLEDGFKVCSKIDKRLHIAGNPLEIARKRINSVRKELNHARKELEENTIYHVISVEITNIHIGRDVGAELELEQLKADGERKRQNAVLREFELKLKEKEMQIKEMEAKHKLMEAEAKVNEALADAFKSGNMGAMDFYRLRNMQADTRMRNSMGSGDEEKH